MASKNNDLKVLFGSMTIGAPGTLAARIHTTDEAAQLLDIFQKHGRKQIDTARLYGSGTTEKMLGEMDYAGRGLLMDTKLYPSAPSPLAPEGLKYWHTPEDVRRGLLDSLKALGAKKLHMFYLHAPDRQHPFIDALREVNKLYEEGYFEYFGVSNYQAWEVAQICEICRNNKWIQPTAYQGMYHLVQRRPEDELFPCLRYYGIALYAYSPLGGGFLTGQYKKDTSSFEPGSRFDPATPVGKYHQRNLWKDDMFDAVEVVRQAAEKHGLTVAETSMRWLKHHSLLDVEKGDAIIVGASRAKHMEQNLTDLEKGPLPEDVVKAAGEAWGLVKGAVGQYTH